MSELHPQPIASARPGEEERAPRASIALWCVEQDDSHSPPETPAARSRCGLLLCAVALPLLALGLLTLLLRVTDADIAFCRLFYSEHGIRHWPWSRIEPFLLLYRHGNVPALVLGFGALLVATLGVFWRRLAAYRAAGFFLAAVLALGPGLMVNGVLKSFWNRPRPKQIVEFGGREAFVCVWGRPTGTGESFPCGHASMGFYLMVPAFLLYRRHRRWAWACGLFGLAAGLALGVARVAQGAHFPSDVLWSAAAVYFSGLLVWCLLPWHSDAGLLAADRHRAFRIIRADGSVATVPPAAVCPAVPSPESRQRTAA